MFNWLGIVMLAAASGTCLALGSTAAEVQGTGPELAECLTSDGAAGSDLGIPHAVSGDSVIAADDVQLRAWWWPPQTCTITPPEPVCTDPVAITVGGEWPDSCIPNASGVAVIGSEIYLDVIWDYPPGTSCLAVITGWSLTESVGPLPPGSYTVYATLWGHPPLPPIPTPVETFTVAGVGPDLDCDGDVDLDDYAVFAACLNGPEVSTPPPGCTPEEFDLADLLGDNDVDLGDFGEFCQAFSP